MHRHVGLALATALLGTACGFTGSEAVTGAALPSSSTASSSTTISTTAPEATTTTDSTTTVLDADIDGRRSELNVALGLAHGAYGLSPNDDQYTCMTGDDVVAIDADRADVTTLAIAVTQMCMPDEFLAVQVAHIATAFPDATNEQLADLDCVVGALHGRLEDLDLGERVASLQVDEPSPEELADVKATCDLTDDELETLRDL